MGLANVQTVPSKASEAGADLTLWECAKLATQPGFSLFLCTFSIGMGQTTFIGPPEEALKGPKTSHLVFRLSQGLCPGFFRGPGMEHVASRGPRTQ